MAWPVSGFPEIVIILNSSLLIMLQGMENLQKFCLPQGETITGIREFKLIIKIIH